MAASSSDPISQRFMQLIQQFGLTKNSFAMSLGKTASVVQHLIEGRNKPGYDLLCKVFEIYPNVSRDWLLLGRGPMLVSGEAAPKLAPARPVAAAPELPLILPEAPETEVPETIAPKTEALETEVAEAPVVRRPGHSNGAGSSLQPADIVATLALAAATAQPARASAPASAADAEPGQPHETRAAAEAVSKSALPAPSPSPDNVLAVAMHTQYLQHQLALAEQRNQHLLEQQQLLREMLEMARH